MFVLSDVIWVAVITSGSTVTGVLLSQRWQSKATAATLENQRRIEQMRDAQQIRDRMDARLRQTLRRVANAALTFEQVTRELTFLMGGETDQQRDRRLANIATEATEGINEARLQLMMEPEGDDIIKPFDVVWNAYMDYQVSREISRQGPGALDPRARKDQLDRLHKGIADLLVAIRSLLLRLDTPMPP